MAWWQLPKEDQPPEEIWGLDDELSAWWEDVDARREAKYGGADGGGREPMTEVPLEQNEYAKALLAGTAK